MGNVIPSYYDYKPQPGDLPGGSVAKVPLSQCRGHRFDPWAEDEIPHAAAKTQSSQINNKGFPGGSVVKDLPCQYRRHGFNL